MARIELGDQVIEYDRELTQRAYSDIKGGDADRCGCSYCRNFSAQRRTAFPAEFLNLLDRIGIDAGKEGEVYDCGVVDELRIYGGWFYFAGKLIEAGERLATLAADFQYWVGDGKHMPKAPADFGSDVLAVEFYSKLPWILPEKPD